MSTLDLSCPSGDLIPIEERSAGTYEYIPKTVHCMSINQSGIFCSWLSVPLIARFQSSVSIFLQRFFDYKRTFATQTGKGYTYSILSSLA